tara:strand:- start:43 stop:486 length:444 start_codon:yes stop_codon:yes gene_type:complete
MSENKVGGVKAAIEALQGLDPEDRQRILAEIALNDPKLAEEIRNSMFQFEDIISLSAADFQKVKQQAKAKVFHTALRNISEDFKASLKALVSARAYQMILDEIQAIGPQKLSHVKECQKEILDLVKALADEGSIALPSKWSKDEYVA